MCDTAVGGAKRGLKAYLALLETSRPMDIEGPQEFSPYRDSLLVPST